jgi:hypothetical protein
LTNDDGLDVMRAAVEVLMPGTLPRTEFKAARVKDRRGKR